MFGKLPAYGFYLRHVRNIEFHQVQLYTEKEEKRPAVITDDVQGLVINNSFNNLQIIQTHETD